jgi:hypothetical protein
MGQVFDSGPSSVTLDCVITIAAPEHHLDCSRAYAYPSMLRKHDHKLQPIAIKGVVDEGGNPFTITVTGVTQDEPIVKRDHDDEDDDGDDDHGDRVTTSAAGTGTGESGGEPGADAAPGTDYGIDDGGRKCPDAVIDPSGNVSVRRERLHHGNGRIYVIAFTASGAGGQCSRTVQVCVPGDPKHRHHMPHHEKDGPCVDDGQLYNSLGPCPAHKLGDDHDGGYETNAARPVTLTLGATTGATQTLQYSLPAANDVRISLHDVAGRRVATLFAGAQEAGTHQLSWSAASLEGGVYFYRLDAGGFRVSKTVLVLK